MLDWPVPGSGGSVQEGLVDHSAANGSAPVYWSGMLNLLRFAGRAGMAKSAASWPAGTGRTAVARHMSHPLQDDTARIVIRSSTGGGVTVCCFRRKGAVVRDGLATSIMPALLHPARLEMRASSARLSPRTAYSGFSGAKQIKIEAHRPNWSERVRQILVTSNSLTLTRSCRYRIGESCGAIAICRPRAEHVTWTSLRF